MEDGIWIIRDRTTQDLTVCKVYSYLFHDGTVRRMVGYFSTDEDDRTEEAVLQYEFLRLLDLRALVPPPDHIQDRTFKFEGWNVATGTRDGLYVVRATRDGFPDIEETNKSLLFALNQAEVWVRRYNAEPPADSPDQP